MIALKVDVDTLRGTLEGVPRLLDILDRHGVRASFLFSLGPDHTGWALRRAFRPGFFSKVQRTSVVAHYGLRTLLYGVLLPAPDIGRRGAAQMRAAQRAGHSCGIHTWDHVVWQDNVRNMGRDWTLAQMRKAFDRYGDIFGQAPDTHGAAGWQMNADALRQIDAWGMPYASDGRGPTPYAPVVDGVRLKHVQLPTTLPTLDELIGVGGLTERNVAQRILQSTLPGQSHVFTLHAELEGGLLAPVFESLLAGWLASGHRLGSLDDAYRSVDTTALPAGELRWGQVGGRSGDVVLGPAASAIGQVRSPAWPSVAAADGGSPPHG